MIREMVLPQLAMGMSEGTIVEWLVAEGECVERDALLVSIETEKVVTELPSPYKGFVHIVADVKTTLPVENLIAQIASTEDEYKQLLEPSTELVSEALVEDKEVNKPDSSVSEASSSTEDSQVKSKIKVSGLAKKIAALKGVALSAITGTGPGGRIVKRDVLLAIDDRKTAAPTSLAGSSATGMIEKARIPLTGMRGAIAKSVLAAKTETAQTETYFEIDVTKLLLARKTMLDREEELGIRVSMVAIYTRALALACQHVPIANATIEGDEVTVWENVNVGITVALSRKEEYDTGIVIPVLKNVESKNVLQISRDIKDLITHARNGELSVADMSDHTVTMSSTAGFFAPGAWGVSAPVLNLPAIVAFQPGTPIKKPVVVDEQIVVRDILPCGVNFDHRAADGVPIGGFIRKISDLLSNPELMIL